VQRSKSLTEEICPIPGWKRLIDAVGGTVALILAFPVIALAMFVVWLSDFKNPLFASYRIGQGGIPFRFLKIRTMVPNASATRVDTTIVGDPRITAVGGLIRALKIDELPQFLNVVRGDMSLVGPRPNVPRETSRYTEKERRLLSVRPGITDYSSIVFADLGQTLAGSQDPNVAYNQLVRPWKSTLGLHYIDTMSFFNDLFIIFLTITAFFARRWTLQMIVSRLRASGASQELYEIASRERPLRPMPPPGAIEVAAVSDVVSRVDDGIA